ncbi:hypothetical protein MUK42_05746 [Musa troglodytarum]|uniref:Uncharacterized protein n=1 Tax=Musa troglodytarum TaxID=320322 RepID=A0A9E7KH31_9LILI|nr:hypothetical protein MUK42_05746 [Musa troglodytarum]
MLTSLWLATSTRSPVLHATLSVGCCIFDIGLRWVHLLCASCNPDLAASPSHFMVSSSSSSCLFTSKPTVVPRVKKPANPQWISTE